MDEFDSSREHADVSHASDAWHSRLGHILFLIYALIYLAFIGLNAFRPDLMEMTPLFGINLAVLFGLGLIVGALALSFIYGWLSRHSQSSAQDREAQP